MPERGADSSLPIHIGQTIVDGMLEVKESVGRLHGKVDGVISSQAEFRAQLAHCVTREECAANMHRRRPSSEARASRKEFWEGAHRKVAVLVGMLAIAATLGGAFYWMSNAYSVIQKARTEIRAASADAGK